MGGFGSSSIIGTIMCELKLKVRKFCGLIPMFVEVTGEKLVGGGLFAPHPE